MSGSNSNSSGNGKPDNPGNGRPDNPGNGRPDNPGKPPKRPVG